MRRLAVLTFCAAAFFTLTAAEAPAAAAAISAARTGWDVVEYDGGVLAHPYGVVHNGTTYLSLSAVENVLHKLDVEHTWSAGTLWVGLQPNAHPVQNKNPDYIHIVNPLGEAAIRRVQLTGPSGTKNSTWLPMWYVRRAIANAQVGVASHWNGRTWLITDTLQSTGASRVAIVAAMTATTEDTDPTTHFAAPGKPVVVSDSKGGTLTAVVGMRYPTADGYGQLVFFFHNDQFIGVSTPKEANQILSVKPGGPKAFDVTYAHYAPNDPMVDPTLPPVPVTYSWNGKHMTPTRSLPTGVLNGLAVTPPTSGS